MAPSELRLQRRESRVGLSKLTFHTSECLAVLSELLKECCLFAWLFLLIYQRLMLRELKKVGL